MGRTIETGGRHRDLGSERGEKRDLFTSIRMTPATKRAAEWLTRVEGLSMNSAYAHALAVLAERTKYHDNTFDDCYHPHDGVWWCKLFLAGLTKETTDVYRAEFISAHRPFFFQKIGKEWRPDEQKIVVLWPQIDFLADHWHKRRELDAWATGEKMQDALKDAKISPPPWGPRAEIER